MTRPASCMGFVKLAFVIAAVESSFAAALLGGAGSTPAPRPHHGAAAKRARSGAAHITKLARPHKQEARPGAAHITKLARSNKKEGSRVVDKIETRKRVKALAKISPAHKSEVARQLDKIAVRKANKALADKQHAAAVKEHQERKAERAKADVFVAKKGGAAKIKADLEETETSLERDTSPRERDAAAERGARSALDIIVRHSGASGKPDDVHIKVQRRAPLRILMDTACERFGLHLASAHFLLNWSELDGAETAESAGLENGSVVVVHEAKLAGLAKAAAEVVARRDAEAKAKRA